MMPSPQWRVTMVLYAIYSAVQYCTVISWLRGEQSNYYPELAEKIKETVVRGRRPRATLFSPLSRGNGLTVPQVALK